MLRSATKRPVSGRPSAAYSYFVLETWAKCTPGDGGQGRRVLGDGLEWCASRGPRRRTPSCLKPLDGRTAKLYRSRLNESVPVLSVPSIVPRFTSSLVIRARYFARKKPGYLETSRSTRQRTRPCLHRTYDEGCIPYRNTEVCRCLRRPEQRRGSKQRA